ncbi:AraC family transcriptional regulator [Desulfovibrio ferrophilus]|uniref:Transcriptional regulator, AraC family n=1 Tax=Desulfovibrio ferrophilus TaxID=241368 RepID=A0A2Z6B138_9BACT|nr:AraC family transcriptional regulator [Desulfovibrio ferrophilus]BBD09222.1 transcriptional regulator, AraC family [Desulfovibrio ferrophilus]
MKPLLNVHFWRDEDLPGLEVAEVRESAHVFPNHSHDHYAIAVMDKGASFCAGNGRDGTCVTSGQVALINPGQVHAGMPAYDGCISYRMLYVDPVWMRRVARDLCGRDGAAPEFPHWVAPDPALHAMLHRLCLLVANGAEGLEKDSAMVGAFSRMLAVWGNVRGAAVSRKGHEHRAVRLVKEYLRARLAEKVSLDELAAHAGLSRFYLLRVFKGETGLSPHAFHTQMRIDCAKGLLLSGASISDAALDAGFSDQSHFTNAFRRFVGATPGQYLAS